jgi:hypothetical protein
VLTTCGRAGRARRAAIRAGERARRGAPGAALGGAHVADEDVGRLHVTVHDLPAMQVVHCKQAHGKEPLDRRKVRGRRARVRELLQRAWARRAKLR